MRRLVRNPVHVRLWMFVALLPVVATGCGPLGVALQQAKDLLAGGAKDVAFAVVDSNGHVYPKTLIVRKDVHSIVWLADADSLEITISSPVLTVSCTGPVCVAKMPPTAAGVIEYSGTIGKGGTSKPLDPHLEVVP